MSNSRSKEYILNRISEVQNENFEFKPNNSVKDTIKPEQIYNTDNEILEIIFAKQLIKMSGIFVFAENPAELKEHLYSLYLEHQWKSIFCNDEDLISLFNNTKIRFTNLKKDFKNIEVGMTTCEYLIARFGSVMVSSKQASGRRLNIYPPSHIVFARSSQLVMEPEEALKKIRLKYSDKMPSLISMITGPSRTADIEKTLVMGAHGPKILYVFLLNDR